VHERIRAEGEGAGEPVLGERTDADHGDEVSGGEGVGAAAHRRHPGRGV
jgi:hypothetical protein